MSLYIILHRQSCVNISSRNICIINKNNLNCKLRKTYQNNFRNCTISNNPILLRVLPNPAPTGVGLSTNSNILPANVTIKLSRRGTKDIPFHETGAGGLVPGQSDLIFYFIPTIRLKYVISSVERGVWYALHV